MERLREKEGEEEREREREGYSVNEFISWSSSSDRLMN